MVFFPVPLIFPNCGSSPPFPPHFYPLESPVWAPLPGFLLLLFCSFKKRHLPRVLTWRKLSSPQLTELLPFPRALLHLHLHPHSFQFSLESVKESPLHLPTKRRPRTHKGVLMGQFASKRNAWGVHFSTNEEGLPSPLKPRGRGGAAPVLRLSTRGPVVENEMDRASTSDSGSLPAPDMGNEESQGPQGKPPVRFGWIIGVMVRCMLNIWGVILFLRLSWITSQAGIGIATTTGTADLTAAAGGSSINNRCGQHGPPGLFVSNKPQHETAELGGNKQTHPSPSPLPVGHSRVEESSAPLEEMGSRVHAVRGVVVTSVTSLSISAIATNGRVVSGGAYFMISRTLGPEIGGPIGIVFSFANALACALNTVGFAEVVRDMMHEFGAVMVDSANDVHIIGVITVTVLLLISLAGMEWESKTQILFFLVLLVSFANYFVGTVIPPSIEKQAFGIFGYRGGCVVRDASGNQSHIMIGNSTDGCVGLACNMGWNFTDCIQSQSCEYGLANSVKVLGQVSGFYYLITAGVFAASLSSALGFLVSAPKVFQCLCKDKIYPYIIFFAKGYGKNDEPLRAYILCYIIAIAFILIGWRPSFQYYSKWTALFGAVISVVLMFLFTWWAALVTFCIILFLFGYVNYNKPKINWGSSVQAGTYNMALSYSVSLTGVEDHVKNFRPQCLVLTGPPNQRPALVDFVGSFTKHISLMICGDIILDGKTQPQETTDSLVEWMNKRKVRSFYTALFADNFRAGAKQLLQASGLGKLKPNTLVLGFKTNWRDINQGFEPDVNVENQDQQTNEEDTADDWSDEGSSEQINTVFQNNQGKKTIDVYWIADDGGLTLLVPYLITRRKRWRRCKVRVFIVGDEQNMEESRNEMLALLRRFRLHVSDVIVMTDIEKHPHPMSLSRFVDSVAPFRLHDEQQEGISVQELRESAPWKISDKEFEAFKLKSETKMRLNEIIRKNSQQTALVLVSLPVPQSDCPSALYMAWLDTLTCGLHCPAVLIRGNQQNVLTFYCQ
ncbi:hypothetical protein CRENBAI_009955 [Crenichthys baileyi]|uniref:Solute carrier family 12 member 10, tandem duplicate 1 n=1 Tax=Crenichthys baileyi TaxID=28760 RepID=A0AAV9QU89_9TELE